MQIIRDIEVLKRKSVDITIEDAKSMALFRKLDITVKKENGLGLSAIQLGIPANVFVMRTISKEYIFVVNPKIIDKYQPKLFIGEQCLSLPGKKANTLRFNYVEAEYLNERGESQHTIFDYLEACVFQHEYDHLCGILMTDREEKLEPYKRSFRKVGRNEICPFCKSGKKFKRCCGK